MKGNREYKSDVFSMLMDDPKNALELYNAMNGSNYTDPCLVEINMPVRSLIYFSNILEGMIKGRNIYGHKLVKIPTPHFAVFYNGDEEQPEVYEQRLSDCRADHMQNRFAV